MKRTHRRTGNDSLDDARKHAPATADVLAATHAARGVKSHSRQPAGSALLVAARALGKDGKVAPSERILMGGIGLGGRGRVDLNAMLVDPDVQFLVIEATTKDKSVAGLAEKARLGM